MPLILKQSTNHLKTYKIRSPFSPTCPFKPGIPFSPGLPRSPVKMIVFLHINLFRVS